jgi:hypothetical protein
MKTRQPAAAGDPQRAEHAMLTSRQNRQGEELAELRIRLLNLEALISRWPGLRPFLLKLPRNLKARYPHLVPFDARYWSRGERERRRTAAAVAFLREHPGAREDDAARAHGVRRATLTQSPHDRDLCLERARAALRSRHRVRTGGTDRAIRYLVTHRPRTLREVAKAACVSPSCLSFSKRFRAAWEAYQERRSR